MIGKVISGSWYVFFTLLLFFASVSPEIMEWNREVFSGITLLFFFQNLGVIAIMFATIYLMKRSVPFLEWSLLSLFTRVDPKTSEKVRCKPQNINLAPAKIRYLGIPFLVLLMINLPWLAGMEESIFRAGTTSWARGVYMSLAFGMIHCFAGVSLAVGLTLSIVGLWLTHQYFIGGVYLSTVHHTTYNLIFISALLVKVLRDHLIPKRVATPR